MEERADRRDWRGFLPELKGGENMTISNLAQFKRAINNGMEYTVVEHFVKPRLSGTRRKPTKVQTNGYYSIVPDDPDHEVSRANGGLGYMNWYGKASDWQFDGDTATQYKKGRPLQTIRFD